MRILFNPGAGITPSPPTLQTALNQSGLGNFGNLEGLGGVNPSLPAYQDFQNNAVKELFSRGGALSGVSPTGAGLPKIGGVPGLPLDPQVPGFSMPNNFPSGGLLSNLSRGQQGIMPGLRAQFENVHPQAPSMEQDQDQGLNWRQKLKTQRLIQFCHSMASNRTRDFGWKIKLRKY